MGATAFPVTPAPVRRWGAPSNRGKTYGLYINNLKKADLVMGNEPTWRDAEIGTIANGSAVAQDKSFASSNFAHADDFFRISEREKQTALARAAYLSYQFPAEYIRKPTNCNGRPLPIRSENSCPKYRMR